MRIRNAMLRNCELNACGVRFVVDGDGVLAPEPSAEVASVLLRLANYEAMEPAEPPAPKPKPKRRTRKRRQATGD